VFVTIGVHAGVESLDGGIGCNQKDFIEDEYYVASAITTHVFDDFITPNLDQYDEIYGKEIYQPTPEETQLFKPVTDMWGQKF